MLENERRAGHAGSADLTPILVMLADNREDEREKGVAAAAEYAADPLDASALAFQKLWMGLFFAMWHADMPLYQRDLAQRLADLPGLAEDRNYWTVVDAFWLVMAREWNRIDRHRIDKYYLLVRLVVAAMFEKLKSKGWDASWVQQFAQLMSAKPLSPTNLRVPVSLKLHMCDVYVDELERVLGDADSQSAPLADLLEPLLSLRRTAKTDALRRRVLDDVMTDTRLADWHVITPTEPAPDDSLSSDWEGFD